MSLAEGRNALQAGDLEAARRAFQAVLDPTEGMPSGEPDRVEALNALLHIHEQEGGDEESVDYLRATRRALTRDRD